MKVEPPLVTVATSASVETAEEDPDPATPPITVYMVVEPVEIEVEPALSTVTLTSEVVTAEEEALTVEVTVAVEPVPEDFTDPADAPAEEREEAADPDAVLVTEERTESAEPEEEAAAPLRAAVMVRQCVLFLATNCMD